MDKVRNVTKNGYHPTGKDGGKESWRGEYKGINQVAGWVGKGKNPNSIQSAQEHSSRPLTSLKDPAAFGPPPKNVKYHGDAVSSSRPTSGVRRQGSSSGGDNIYARPWQPRNEEAAAKKPAPPPVPYRANTTGLSTSGLPPPPVRGGDDVGGGAPHNAATKPKPNLPPRLPPRQNSHPGERAPSPPPTYSAIPSQEATQKASYLNNTAIGRLKTAGVSVPGLGIGGEGGESRPSTQSQNPWRDQIPSRPPSTTTSPPPTVPSSQNPWNDQASSPLGGLQTRFSSLKTSPPPSQEQSTQSLPSQGTSLAQKQAALRTASLFHKDPSSISLSDARATASTANNFRERHGDQVASGWKAGNAMNKNYGVMEKVGGIAGDNSTAASGNGVVEGEGNPAHNPWAEQPSSDPSHTAFSPSTTTPASPLGGLQSGSTSISGGAFKKAPPPPPGRRPGVGQGPPPVPLGSKPR